ncbi:3'-5' exonuclease isoform X3 [Cryptomeria japonica]|uniref:3'-5' exonuclease isoform X3 n=1 Tax=Cryptomeria japonica TaxID=3369 RepID=UPI0027DA45CB|nr:3'-5' exonuclease isoform X3 [Cryptomeria japonica]
MAASTNSIEDLAIPYEWVDADEFEAIENALAEATKSHKRVKMSPSDDIAADSAGRRLPDWAGNSSKIVTYGSSHKPRVSINSDDNSIDYSVQGQRIESPNLNLSHSWLFSVPLCRVGEVPTKVAVLQICLDADRCDVMHIIHSGIPPVLRSLLEDESSVKVGVCIAGDAYKMRKDYNVNVRGIEDLGTIACRKIRPPRTWSLSRLCEKLTGKEVDKPMNIRCGNWEVENLSVPQLQYAATDAYASWYLYEVLKSLPDVIMANSKEEENH